MQHFKRAGVRLEADRGFKASRDITAVGGKRKFNSAIKLKIGDDFDSSHRLTSRYMPASLGGDAPVQLTR